GLYIGVLSLVFVPVLMLWGLAALVFEPETPSEPEYAAEPLQMYDPEVSTNLGLAMKDVQVQQGNVNSGGHWTLFEVADTALEKFDAALQSRIEQGTARSIALPELKTAPRWWEPQTLRNAKALLLGNPGGEI